MNTDLRPITSPVPFAAPRRRAPAPGASFADADQTRGDLTRAAGDVTVQLRLAENAAGRARAAVAWIERTVTQVGREERDARSGRVARSRELARLGLLAGLEVEGIALELDRARRAALRQQEELDRFFLALDGRRAGPAFGLRLRLLVCRAFAADGQPAKVRARLFADLERCARIARGTAAQIARLRAAIDLRSDSVRALVEETAAGLWEIA